MYTTVSNPARPERQPDYSMGFGKCYPVAPGRPVNRTVEDRRISQLRRRVLRWQDAGHYRGNTPRRIRRTFVN